MLLGSGGVVHSAADAEHSTSVLLAADEWLDGPIRMRLRDGTIRLLKCDWLASDASDEYLARSPDGEPIMRRRQEMPEAAFVPAEEAAILFARGERKVLVISYGWHTSKHPDPTGIVLREVRRYLRADPSTRGCALFWDVASRPQPPCTAEERDIGEKALMVMSSFYASITGTAVLQQKAIPDRPALYDGTLQLFAVSEELRDEAALRADLASFGALETCEILPALVDLDEAGAIRTTHSAHAFVRFASHEHAEVAAESLRSQGRAACLGWNGTLYEGVGGRGWCIVEQGAAKVVLAHLNAAAKRSGGLPARFARAQSARPKIIDLTGGKAEVVLVPETPEEMLDLTIDALSHARFTFSSDKTMAEEMMADFELTIRTAMPATHTHTATVALPSSHTRPRLNRSETEAALATATFAEGQAIMVEEMVAEEVRVAIPTETPPSETPQSHIGLPTQMTQGEPERTDSAGHGAALSMALGTLTRRVSQSLIMLSSRNQEASGEVDEAPPTAPTDETASEPVNTAEDTSRAVLATEQRAHPTLAAWREEGEEEGQSVTQFV